MLYFCPEVHAFSERVKAGGKDCDLGILRFQKPVILSNSEPRIFAVLIGIDTYQNIPHSSQFWAADRALQAKQYLEMHLGLSNCYVNVLLDGTATRDAIIKALEDLKTFNIKKGEPILVYYAGLGGEICPDILSTTLGYVVPQDFAKSAKHDVSVISHREIASLLSDLAMISGDNITIIFDHHPNPKLNALVNIPSVYFPDVDDNCHLAGFTYYEARHVALQSTLEIQSDITQTDMFKVLFQLLHMKPPHKLRHAEIISRVERFSQKTPRVEGANVQKTLFNGRILVDRRNFFEATPSSLSGRLTLGAGTMHGISCGAEFAIYPRTNIFIQKPLGVFSVHSVGACWATLIPVELATSNLDLEDIFCALQTKVGAYSEENYVRINIPPEDQLACANALRSRIESKDTEEDHLILPVDNVDIAHYQIKVDNGKAIFAILDQGIHQYGPLHLTYQVEPTVEDIFTILKAAADFHSVLNRSNINSSIVHDVHVQLYKVGTAGRSNTILIPQDGKLVLADNCLLGLTLVNHSPNDLYPYLYYFDHSDLSIRSVYRHPAAIDTSPMKKNGGDASFRCDIEAQTILPCSLGDNLEFGGRVGHFKLFLLKEPIEELFLDNPQSTSPNDDRWATGNILTILQRRSSSGTALHST